MNNSLFPSALREMRQYLLERNTLVGMAALGMILGISGPFDTFGALPLLARIAYWTTVVAMTYATGALISKLVHAILAPRPLWLVMGLSICVMGVVITGILVAFHFLALNKAPTSWAELLILTTTVTLIAAVVEICSFALSPADMPSSSDAGHPPTLLDRLPLEKRGALIAISAEDHYVRVATTKDSEMLLMRLSDAMKEVSGIKGLQIHRSHWVALGQIVKVTRTGDRGEVTLSDQTTRPVSRGYMPAIRAAGLLPKPPRL